MNLSRKTHGAIGGAAPSQIREYATGPSQVLVNVVTFGSIASVNYSPLELPHNATAYGIVVFHGAAVAGNFYVALYDSLNYAPRNRLAVSASTAVSAINCMQYVPFTVPVNLPSGLYYCALEVDTTVGNQWYSNAIANRCMLPANINNGLLWYTEDLGLYAIPPAVATPVIEVSAGDTFSMRLRVLGI